MSSKGDICGVRGPGRRSLGARSGRGGVLRPTTSKVREALFNILAPVMDGSVFADLYSGSGGVGLEAMSRGAREVYMVEADQRRAREIEGLIEGCGCRSKAQVRSQKASAFIRHAVASSLRFDIVFLDPPYESDEYAEVMGLLVGGECLNPGARVIAEHRGRYELPEAMGRLVRLKTYRYGDTSLSMYIISDPTEEEA